MKKYFFLSCVFFLNIYGNAQKINLDSTQISFNYSINLDSLEHLLNTKIDEVSRIDYLAALSWRYSFIDPDKAIFLGQKGIELSQKLGDKRRLSYCTQSFAMGLWALGNYSTSLQFALDALHQSEELMDDTRIAFSYIILANVYRDFGDYEKALRDIKRGISFSKGNENLLRVGYAIASSIYELKNHLDSAEYFIQKSHELDLKINGDSWGWIYTIMGNLDKKRGNYVRALNNYQKAIPKIIGNGASKDIVDIYNSLAQIYEETGKIDSCIYYANEVLGKLSSISYQKGVLEAINILVSSYKIKNERDSTLKYLELSIALNNKLFNQQKERDIQNLSFNEQLRKDEQIRQQTEFRNMLKIYTLLIVVAIFVMVAYLLWRNNQHRKKAYSLLEKQKRETETQKLKVEQTLSELRSTQSQLIQSEKMASLGELTAGIAHEIQNPLNFVNNFSEINTELAKELDTELSTGNVQQAKEIAYDIKTNSEKINHHGKRAESIVKGMLEHSRKSTGVKEPTDINKLCDEFVRLSYHGLRAKDNTFNCDYKLDLDPKLPLVNVVSQDIGRVLLNIINNAFQACAEKKQFLNNNVNSIKNQRNNDQALDAPSGGGGKKNSKDNSLLPPTPEGAQNLVYHPLVSISTNIQGNNIEIRISDNGPGIPDSIKGKIFQPFFTTKPTGQGTGLGLSLSYDIVKAHGGELKVETKEGEGSEFIIQLPTN